MMQALLDTSLQHPLFGTALTLLAYVIGLWVYRVSASNLLQPVFVGMALVMAVLYLTELDYARYFASAQLIHGLLGTATVALAIPLYENARHIRQHSVLILSTVLVMGAVAASSALLIAWLAGADTRLLLSVAPKSITTPFALGVSELLGGIPALTASVVVITGVFTALIAPALFRLNHTQDPLIQGCTLGLAGHGVATARAFEISPLAGAYSALVMGLMGVYTVLVLPWALTLAGLI